MGPNERVLNRMADFVEDGATAYSIASVEATLDPLQQFTAFDTKHAKASYTVALGSPAPGFPQKSRELNHAVPPPSQIVAQGTRQFKLGDTIVIGNVAGHSAIIAGGRRMGSHGRMIGSLQAPKPYIPIAIAVGEQVMKSWRFQAR